MSGNPMTSQSSLRLADIDRVPEDFKNGKSRWQRKINGK